MRRAVHVAGRGAVTSYGSDLGSLVDGIFSGGRGVRPRVRTRAFPAPTEVAGEFQPGSFDGAPQTELPFLSSVAACKEALEEAGVTDPGRVGLILGTTKADLSGLQTPGSGFASPARLARRVVEHLGLATVHAAVSTACTSGVSALAMAERRIAAGEVDRILVVGVDTLSEFVMRGFGSMHILDPEPSRPYDISRRGISLGEAAAAMVLSSVESESVGTRIAGHGGANDAVHVTGCDREGRGVCYAVQRAIEHAGIQLSDIDVMHLHGTGTEANDRSEAVGLGKAFGGTTPLAFGTKGQTGHTLGAAGVVESLLTIAALERGEVPRNVGLEEPGVDARLSLTRERLSLDRARYGLKVASGFGGIQQTMVFAV